MGFRTVLAQVTTRDGLELHLFALVPERPRGALFFVHGLGEHIGRYERIFVALAERGWSCWGVDLRGHGQSAGRRGHVDRFEDYFEDLDAAREFAAASAPGIPVALVGHSMGGLVGIEYLRSRPTAFEAAVLSGPAFAPHPDLCPPAWKAGLGRILSRLLPTTRFATGIDPAHLSRDPAVGQAYAQDPRVVRHVTARWYVEIDRAGRRSAEDHRPVPVPTLVFRGDADRLVDVERVAEWVASCEGPIELHTVQGGYHELLQEPDRGKLLRRIDTWLTETGFAPSRSITVTSEPPTEPVLLT